MFEFIYLRFEFFYPSLKSLYRLFKLGVLEAKRRIDAAIQQ